MAKRKKRLTEADRERLERMQANIDRTRRVAEKAQAELDRRKQQPA